MSDLNKNFSSLFIKLAKKNFLRFILTSTLQNWFVKIPNFSFRPLHYCLVRSSHQRCSLKKVVFKISQYSQENTRAWVSFSIKLQAWSLQRYKKKRPWHRCFPEFCEIFKNTFFKEHLRTIVSALCIDCLSHIWHMIHCNMSVI